MKTRIRGLARRDVEQVRLREILKRKEGNMNAELFTENFNLSVRLMVFRELENSLLIGGWKWRVVRDEFYLYLIYF